MEREHVKLAKEHPQPVPLIAVAVSPRGNESVTETAVIAPGPMFWTDRV